jgi:hypothetical protein
MPTFYIRLKSLQSVKLPHQRFNTRITLARQCTSLFQSRQRLSIPYCPHSNGLYCRDHQKMADMVLISSHFRFDDFEQANYCSNTEIGISQLLLTLKCWFWSSHKKLLFTLIIYVNTASLASTCHYALASSHFKSRLRYQNTITPTFNAIAIILMMLLLSFLATQRDFDCLMQCPHCHYAHSHI